MSKPNLRAVKAGDKPPKRRPLTLAEAVETGDQLQILLAQRRDIVSSLPDEKGPAKAALHRQLSAISKEVADLQAATEDESDEPSGADIDNSFDASAI